MAGEGRRREACPTAPTKAVRALRPNLVTAMREVQGAMLGDPTKVVPSFARVCSFSSKRLRRRQSTRRLARNKAKDDKDVVDGYPRCKSALKLDHSFDLSDDSRSGHNVKSM